MKRLQLVRTLVGMLAALVGTLVVIEAWYLLAEALNSGILSLFVVLAGCGFVGWFLLRRGRHRNDSD